MSHKIKVSINGFGRIGRSLLRAYFQYPEKYEKNIDIVAVNDIADLKTLTHLFKYDSVMGKFQGSLEVDGNHLIINGKKIRFTQSAFDEIDWKSVNTDVVIESTGRFLSKKDGETHIKNGAKKVIFSAPAKEEVDATIVVGVNDSLLTPNHQFVSNSSCTTNCLAPIIQILEENFGLESALMVTVHSYTNDQNILDAYHGDLRRARAAAVSIIPTSTGATKAVEKVLPQVKGKLAGYALRVPTPNVSITDVTARLKTKVTVEKINDVFKKAAQDKLKGILEYCTEEVVSSDIMGNPYSSVFDSLLTQVVGSESENIRVVSWYDNEWGYSNRLLDLASIMGNLR